MAGFKDGKVPMAINMAIGNMAAIQALHIAGDLVLGAGIASSSLSVFARPWSFIKSPT